ncbi:hypothetical protein CO661_33575 [Sinorhizobium fredii]|uniref:Phasin domain-containing protein n=2 Tax=Sinorhizobium TaxID=28105 RepID=A0A2A6LMC2_RHIFR|nr:phasin family protein [Sinorhizobium fredii]PDT43724.1 hypothetical protein CO661_33575 [Sinorhizobium fredii]
MSRTAEKPFETVENSIVGQSTAINRGEQLTHVIESQELAGSVFKSTMMVGFELSLNTFAAVQANTFANLHHLSELIGAKSPSQVFDLQCSFLRKRIDMGVEQVKESQALSTKALIDMSKPIKEFFEKVIADLKTA